MRRYLQTDRVAAVTLRRYSVHWSWDGMVDSFSVVVGRSQSPSPSFTAAATVNLQSQVGHTGAA